MEPPTIPGILSSSPKRETPFAGSAMPLPSTTANSGNISDSPVSSLERNLKPSDILRQKTADTQEAKTFMANRKTTPEVGKYLNTPELLEEFGRKSGGKSESLEKTKRTEITVTQSPTGSLGRTASTPNRSNTPVRSGLNAIGVSPTGSLNKTAKIALGDSISTGSLEKKSRSSLQGGAEAEVNLQEIGSKESLASQGNISEIVSYIYNPNQRF